MWDWGLKPTFGVRSPRLRGGGGTFTDRQSLLHPFKTSSEISGYKFMIVLKRSRGPVKSRQAGFEQEALGLSHVQGFEE